MRLARSAMIWVSAARLNGEQILESRFNRSLVMGGVGAIVVILAIAGFVVWNMGKTSPRYSEYLSYAQDAGIDDQSARDFFNEEWLENDHCMSGRQAEVAAKRIGTGVDSGGAPTIEIAQLAREAVTCTGPSVKEMLAQIGSIGEAPGDEFLGRICAKTSWSKFC